MNDKKFSAEKSCEIALYFLKKLQVDCVDRFSEAGMAGLCRIISALSCNSTAPQLWNMAYQITFGHFFTDKIWISEEEVLTVLISLCTKQMSIDVSKFIEANPLQEELENLQLKESKLAERMSWLRTPNQMFYWESGLMELIDSLFFIRYLPDKNEKESKIWKEIVIAFGNQESLHKESSLVEGSFPGARFSDLLKEFTREIFVQYQDRLQPAAFDDLNVYYSDLCYAYHDTYEEIYKRMTGNSGLEVRLLTKEALFTLVIEMCAMHIYKWDFHLKELLILLFAIRYSSGNDKDEVSMWKAIWEKLLLQIVD